MAIQSKMQENYIFIEKNRFHKKLDFQLKKKKLFFHTVGGMPKGNIHQSKNLP